MTKFNRFSRGNTLNEQRMARTSKNAEPSKMLREKAEKHNICNPSNLVRVTTTIEELSRGMSIKTCWECGIDTFELEEVRKYNAKNQSKTLEPIQREILATLENIRDSLSDLGGGVHIQGE